MSQVAVVVTPTALAICQRLRATISVVKQRVLLLGPDDEARRALHVLVATRGNDVVAASDLDSAKKHVTAAECDVVLATAELAAAATALDGVPVIAVL